MPWRYRPLEVIERASHDQFKSTATNDSVGWSVLVGLKRAGILNNLHIPRFDIWARLIVNNLLTIFLLTSERLFHQINRYKKYK